MTLIDRALAAVSPTLALKRALARHGLAELSGLDAARRRPGDAGWRPVMAGPNAIAASDGPRARAAARAEARNNPIAAAGAERLSAVLVGSGFEPRLTSAGDRTRRTRLAAWREFRRTADPMGARRSDAFVRLAVRAMITGGFSFLRYRPGPVESPLLLDVLSADHLDIDKNMDLPDGGYVAFGMEFDALGRIRAYWLFDRHPNEHFRWKASLQARRVPAAEIWPLMRPTEPGEMIPNTWLAPAVTTLADRRNVLESERRRAFAQSCLAMVIRGGPSAALSLKNAGAGEAGGALTQEVGAFDNAGNRLHQVSPGMIANATGEDVQFFSPAGDFNLSAFADVQTGDTATTLGMALFMLSGDMRQVNYSSAQVGYHLLYQMVDVWQSELVEPLYDDMWRRVMAAWGRLGRLTGAQAPDPTWARPARPSADPAKQAKADAENVSAGFATTPEVLRRNGRDPLDAIREQTEHDRAEAAARSAAGLSPRPAPGAAPAQPAQESPEAPDDA